MGFWFVVHSLEAYRNHSDLIGCRVKKSGSPKPNFRQFAEIRKGDRIVYYATKDHVIVGIFVVVSDMIHLTEDPHWKEMVAYVIRPSEMPRRGFHLNFKKALISHKASRFDLFPKMKYWYSYLQGKPCRKLTKHDYSVIKNWFRTTEYLVENTEAKESRNEYWKA